MTRDETRSFLAPLFDAAVAAALPEKVVPPHLPTPPKGRTIVLGAGKASAAMAKAVEDHWPGPLEGLVVTRTGHGVPCRRDRDRRGLASGARRPRPRRGAAHPRARRERRAGRPGARLISGGGSALLALPAEGLTLADKQAVNRALLASGADIGEMNTVRKHLSAIKGGRLAAAAYPAELVSLLISDVPGDDPERHRLRADGRRPVDLRRCRRGPRPLRHRSAAGRRRAPRRADDETPKPGDARLSRTRDRHHRLAARQPSRGRRGRPAAGVTPLILGDAIEGEAREVGKAMAGIALSAKRHGTPAAAPVGAALRRRDDGHGQGQGPRRAQCRVPRRPRPRPPRRSRHLRARRRHRRHRRQRGQCRRVRHARHARPRRGPSASTCRRSFANNDCYSLFAALGDLVVTGPTLTNVNDFRAILIEADTPPTSSRPRRRSPCRARHGPRGSRWKPSTLLDFATLPASKKADPVELGDGARSAWPSPATSDRRRRTSRRGAAASSGSAAARRRGSSARRRSRPAAAASVILTSTPTPSAISQAALAEARLEVVGAEHDDDDVERLVAHQARIEVGAAVLLDAFDRVVADGRPAAEPLLDHQPGRAERGAQNARPALVRP